jgi:hypothetical protein
MQISGCYLAARLSAFAGSVDVRALHRQYCRIKILFFQYLTPFSFVDSCERFG